MLRGCLLPCFLILFLPSCALLSRCLSLRVTGYTTAPACYVSGLSRLREAGTVHPLKGKLCFWSVPCSRSAFHVAASKGSLCSSYPVSAGSLPRGEAFLMQAGATCKGVLPRLPTEIRFDPCTASVLSSEGRGGAFNGSHAGSVFLLIEPLFLICQAALHYHCNI